MSTTKILGFLESHNQCDCCGRNGLKGTYAVLTENGDIYHMGSRCVIKREGFTKESEIKESISKYRDEVREKARLRYKEIGGYEVEEKMSKLEFDTPEHYELWDKLDELKGIIKNEFYSEYITGISL